MTGSLIEGLFHDKERQTTMNDWEKDKRACRILTISNMLYTGDAHNIMDIAENGNYFMLLPIALYGLVNETFCLHQRN